MAPATITFANSPSHVKDGIRAAGGTPLEFNTVSISDGITMGTEGMRASLVSREVITDSIELVTRGNLFDALIVLVGCDKTIPGGIMAAGASEYSRLWFFTAARSLPANSKAIPSRFRTFTKPSAATRTATCPTRGSRHWKKPRAPERAPAADSSPPTPWRSSANFSALLPWDCPAFPPRIPAKHNAGHRAGELVMDLLRGDVTPSKIITKAAIENAIAGVAATGGSTNSVLHLLAIANEARIPLTIDDFDRISARIPIIADLKPGGRFVATDLYAAGGTALVAKRLIDAKLLRGDAITVTGRTIARRSCRRKRNSQAGSRAKNRRASEDQPAAWSF